MYILQIAMYILHHAAYTTCSTMKNRIKYARRLQGLTQSELAAQVGCTRQTIGLIEAGKFNPSLQLCLEIARVLNKTLDELFWFKEQKNER